MMSRHLKTLLKDLHCMGLEILLRFVHLIVTHLCIAWRQQLILSVELLKLLSEREVLLLEIN